MKNLKRHMTASKSHIKEITIPLLLVVVGSLLQSVFPSSEALERLLLSYLKNKWLVWELKVSIVALLVLSTYRVYLKYSEKKVSTEIIKSYMKTAYDIEAEAYRKNVTSLNKDFVSRGIWSSGLPIRPIMDTKISHTKIFIDNCIKYIESTQDNYLLDKPSVKVLFEHYQSSDTSEITAIINKENEMRDLKIRQEAIQQEIMPPIISEINNAYEVALLRIDAM